MCGRFVQYSLPFPEAMPWPQLARDLAEMTPRYNLAPTQRAAVILAEGGVPALVRLRWGLLPHWIKDLKQSYSTINARIETVAVKPAYRNAWKHRRCVIPMAGYYEWRPTKTGKQPYYLSAVDGKQLFAAAIWEPRHGLQAIEESGSCCVITTDARDAAGIVHDRMPVFLPAELIERYMRADSDEAMQILMAAPVPALKVRPVSRRVNAPRDDDAGLLDEIDYVEE